MAVQLVDWSDVLAEEQEHIHSKSLVGDGQYCCLIPLLHRVLANPDDRVQFPRLSKDCSLTQACAWWETAVYMLNYLLGWRRVGEGLREWYRQGRNDHGDERLRLLQTVWNDRGELDLLAAWYWRGDGANHRPLDAFARSEGQPSAASSSLPFPDAAWWGDLLRRHPGYGVAYNHDPFHGGSNPLHLGHSNPTAHDPHDDSEWIVCESTKRRAVLMLDQAEGWYATLARLGAALPVSGPHSWRVDVVVRPLGWLGTFRRSSVTGLWFQGKHSVHMMGQ